VVTPDEWLSRLAKLKVDKASGDPAPPKPLLLLVAAYHHSCALTRYCLTTLTGKSTALAAYTHHSMRANRLGAFGPE
jgi:hypothetical protein